MPQASRQRGTAAGALPWSIVVALLFISAWRWSSLGDSAEPLLKPWQDTAATGATAALATLQAGGAFEDYRPALERALVSSPRVGLFPTEKP